VGRDVLWIATIALAASFVWFAVLLRIIKKLHPMPFLPLAAPILSGPQRCLFQPPGRVIERSGVRRGMCVLEVGPGNGAVTVPLARLVGPEGRVVCLDLQPAMLKKLRALLARPRNADIANVATVCADAEKLPFADGSFDAVLMVEVLGEVPDKAAALRECLRVLRPGGLLAVTEMIVDPDYALPRTIERLAREAGFRPVARRGHFWDYTAIFEKADREAWT
jgi:ubiquinone/menaquinone biosynthesis C-methylase UbiE